MTTDGGGAAVTGRSREGMELCDCVRAEQAGRVRPCDAVVSEHDTQSFGRIAKVAARDCLRCHGSGYAAPQQAREETTVTPGGEYFYKDANRDWWRLRIVRGRPEPVAADPSTVDYWWSYTLSREDCGEYVPALDGKVKGLYDAEPSVLDVMKEITCQVTCLTLGFAAYPGERRQTEE